jgi:hypothetical protein
VKCPKCRAESPDYAYYCGSCASELKGGNQAEAGEGDSRRAKPRIKIESILYRNLVRVGENVARKRRGLTGRFTWRSGTIVFKSEFEEVSLCVDKEGNVSVNRGIPAKSATMLEGPHDSFLMMFLDERHVTAVPESIEVSVEGIKLPHDEVARQILRDAADKLLRNLFE